MTALEIKQLFNYKRLPESPGNILILILYAPIGSALVLFRSLIILAVYLLNVILPSSSFFRNFLHKLYNIAFGVVINVDDENKKEDVEAYIGNKITILDASVVNFVTNSISPIEQSDSIFSSVVGLQKFKESDVEDLKKYIDSMSTEKLPLFIQPEISLTNGKGLLKFNLSPFTVFNKLQPVAITVDRPFISLPISTISSTYWNDLFWYMFVPFTVYKIKFLSVVEKKGAGEEEYADKIRQNMANDLKIELTNYLPDDLKEYKKRFSIEQQRTQPVQRPRQQVPVNPELHQMTMQVKEVLPAVPYNIIYKELTKTRSVDITITNILEGFVPYIPEQPRTNPSTVSSTVPTSTRSTTTTATSLSSSSSSFTLTSGENSRTSLNTGAPVFGKSSQERTLSFQERKKQLIDNARKRYIDKHGLNIDIFCKR